MKKSVTNFTTNQLHNVYNVITHNCYMFRPYILAIFKILKVWSTCEKYILIFIRYCQIIYRYIISKNTVVIDTI